MLEEQWLKYWSGQNGTSRAGDFGIRSQRNEGRKPGRYVAEEHCKLGPIPHISRSVPYLCISQPFSQTNLTSQPSPGPSCCLGGPPSELSSSLKSWPSTQSSDFHRRLSYFIRIVWGVRGGAWWLHSVPGCSFLGRHRAEHGTGHAAHTQCT